MLTLNETQIEKALSKLRNKSNSDIAIKLLSRVNILEDTNCWIISRDWSEYSVFNGYIAHCLSYELFNSDIVNKNYICHSCDRKGCINPEHIFQGSASVNNRDSRRKKAMFKFGNSRVKENKIKSWRFTVDVVSLLIDRNLIKDTFTQVKTK